MSIATTCIGAYPKPDYVEIGNFAETGAPDKGQTRVFSYTQDSADKVSEELLQMTKSNSLTQGFQSNGVPDNNREEQDQPEQ